MAKGKTDDPQKPAPKKPVGAGPVVTRLFEELGKVNRNVEALRADVAALKRRPAASSKEKEYNIFDGQEEE